MDNTPDEEILQLSFNLYKILGETFDDTAKNISIKLKTFRFVTCFILILNFILTTVSFGQAEGEIYIKSLEGSMSILHV